MHLLCPLTEWKTERAERGRAVGKEVTSRTVLAADRWNWVIGTQRGDENANIVGEKFLPSMRLVMKHLYQGDIEQSVPDRIAGQLEERTGIKPPTLALLLTIADWELYGKELDNTYGTSYGREYRPQVVKRIFGEQTEESE